jgi:DNA mismatch endonuclease (patch repair protein)
VLDWSPGLSNGGSARQSPGAHPLRYAAYVALSRSAHMARIRGTDTAPEWRLRRILWGRGLRYRLRLRISRTTPDLSFPARRIAVFCDGCFWHGCPVHYTQPRSNQAFWAAKLRENVARDRRQTAALTRDGWHILRFWGHELFGSLEAVADEIEMSVREKVFRYRDTSRIAEVDTNGHPTSALEKRLIVTLDDELVGTWLIARRNSNTYPRPT